MSIQFIHFDHSSPTGFLSTIAGIENAINPLLEQTKKSPNRLIPKQTVLNLQYAIERTGVLVPTFSKTDQLEIDNARNQVLHKFNQIVVHNDEITKQFKCSKNIAEVCLGVFAALAAIAVYHSYT